LAQPKEVCVEAFFSSLKRLEMMMMIANGITTSVGRKERGFSVIYKTTGS